MAHTPRQYREFLTLVASNLNDELTIQCGCLDAISNSEISPGVMEDMITMVIDSQEKTRWLVDSILKFDRPESTSKKSVLGLGL
jgi:hypothetical protein